MKNKILVIGLIITAFFAGGIVDALQQEQQLTQALNQEKLFSIVQSWRYNNKLSTLSYNQLTCDVADKRVEEIQTDWSHKGFDKYTEQFGPGVTISENLGKDTSSEQAMLDMWLNSASHSATLKDPRLKTSCLRCKNNRCVQIFSSLEK